MTVSAVGAHYLNGVILWDALPGQYCLAGADRLVVIEAIHDFVRYPEGQESPIAVRMQPENSGCVGRGDMLQIIEALGAAADRGNRRAGQLRSRIFETIDLLDV